MQQASARLARAEMTVPSAADDVSNNVTENTLSTLLHGSWIGVGDALCEKADQHIGKLLELRDDAVQSIDDPTSALLPGVVLCISLVVLVAGARLFRIAAAFAAAAFSYYVVYTFGRRHGDRISCEALVILSSVAALLAALAAGCVYKLGLFFIGAAAMVFAVHLVFSAFPELHYIYEQPLLADKSIAYWGLLLVAGVAGGAVLRWHSKSVLEAVTACIGGAGIAYSLHAIFDIFGARVHDAVFLSCGVGASAVGLLVQRHLRLRGCKRRKPDSQRAA